MTERMTVDVEGRRLTLSNLDKVLYPDDGFTKGEVIDYYTRIADVLLPHLAGRPLTVIRYPNGLAGRSFFEKNAARSKPEWVRTVTLDAPGSTKNRDTIDYLVVEELATLVWLANLAALELHVPQWRVDETGAPLDADELVIDLDPGEPAGLTECAEVALLLREILVSDGFSPVVKTSGSKGMQLNAAIDPVPSAKVSQYVHSVAQVLERQHRQLVLSSMKRELRAGKIFLDWSQNNAAKTTVAPYSLRARRGVTASTPLDWNEVANDPLSQFTAAAVLDRVGAAHDLYAGALADELRSAVPEVG